MNRIPRRIDGNDPNYFDKTWKILEDVINELYSHNADELTIDENNRSSSSLFLSVLFLPAFLFILNRLTSVPLIRLSTHVSGLLWDYKEKLYIWIVDTITSNVNEISNYIGAVQEAGLFLEELNRKWKVHYNALQRIEGIFHGLSPFIYHTGKTHFFRLGLNLWRDNIIRSGRFRNTLQDLLHKERCAKVILPMRFVITMLKKLSVSSYEEEFEEPFLEVLAEFHRAESQRLMECCGDCADYLKKVERCIKEIEGVTLYLRLSEESEVKITNVVEKEMIENHMLRLVHMENSGLVKMLLDDKYEDLGRTYNLFCRVINGLSTIREVMTSHLRETGKQLVTDAENLKDAVGYVQRLLDEKDKYDKIINKAFKNDETFHNALNSSFEYFINLNPRSPEFLSLFVDDKLRKGLEGASEEDVEIILDKVMRLFRYLQEKDVFQKYYKQHLAERLLSGKSASEDAERSFLVKLKTECGNQFTAKIEAMFRDMKKSEDTMKGFYADHVAEGATATLAVHVLRTDARPTESIVTCNLPAELSSLCEKFRAYYMRTHLHTKLCWQTNMGTADIKATFGNGQKHELNVSTHQMCVLMLFNNADKLTLTYKEIEQATQIPSPDLKTCLESLACVEGKDVLRKEPMSKDIGEDDEFFVNQTFSSKFYKVKIGTVAQKEPEKQQIRQRVEADRKYAIDAAIIRIMKSRRLVDHNSLIAEVAGELQPRFSADPVAIEKQIKSLIERDYLTMDKDESVYRYMP